MLVILHADSFRFYNISNLLIVNHAVIVILDQNPFMSDYIFDLILISLQWDKNI